MCMNHLKQFSKLQYVAFYSLRKDYERIADMALTTPTNTQHLMELKEAMIEAESKELPVLEEKMIEARHR